jgi:hypothetical protein
MIDFFNLVDDKEMERELALTESMDVIQYIYDLDPDKQEKFLKRLEKIFGETYITITREAVKYLKEQKKENEKRN